MTATSTRKTKWCEIKGACPCCGHRNWCTTSEDGSVIKCMRAKSNHPIKQRDGSVAYLHRAGQIGGAAQPADYRRPRPRLTKTEIQNLLKSHRTAINVKRLEQFASSLGLSVKALRAYGVGYDSERGAWTFPMYDGERNVIGIHCRDNNGNKCCIRGSRLGLFIPENYDPRPVPEELTDDPHPLLLALPEGLTDACTAFDFGFVALGRPSNCAGTEQIVKLLQSLPKQEVVVVADNDHVKYLPDGTPFWPGIEGAVGLAEAVLPHAGRVKFMITPDGAKDLREWKRAGGDFAALLAQILGAPVVTKEWIVKARKRLDERKRKERKPAA